MSWNSSGRDLESTDQEITWNLSMHKVITTILIVVGTVINFVAIFVILKGGLYRQKPFTFVLNLFVGNLLMCSIGFPLYITPAFSSIPRHDVNCPFSGFFMFSLTGTSLLNLVLISINRYILIVQFTYYERIYSKRNTLMILVVSWLFYPIIYIFPIIWEIMNVSSQNLQHFFIFCCFMFLINFVTSDKIVLIL
ncbi:G-protein coupled receptor moody-like [Saccostrea cucullata]|uniref:G-protein coupled receptor moody-like n=1 Tax=Saccostrea cuccullata TaxID=36930 RepID=UPI002ED50116